MSIRHPDRLSALERTGLLDGNSGSPVFERATRLACRLLNTRAAAFSLVAQDRHVFVAQRKNERPVDGPAEMPLEESLCRYVVEHGGPFAVEDARSDPRLAQNEAIRRGGVVAYLGVPVSTPDGHELGALCVYQEEPRSWRDEEREMLEDISSGLASEIAHRLALSRAEELSRQLMLEERRFRVAAETARLVVWDRSVDDNRIWWSDQLPHVLDYAPDELSDVETWTGRIVEADRERVRQRKSAAISGGDLTWDDEFSIRRGDGTVRRIVTNARIFRDAEGELERVIGCFRDVTDERDMEGRLRRSERAESLGRLVGGVAHELNNSLTVIQGNAELILSGRAAEADLQDLLRMILGSSSRAASVIEQMLVYGQRMILRPDPVDPREHIRFMLPTLRQLAGDSVEVTLELDQVGGTLEVDVQQFDQAVFNLIRNAAEACAPGGHIRIELGRLSLGQEGSPVSSAYKPGDYLALAISDDGPGMTEEVRTRAFEPFFSTRQDELRTGLGLSQVYGFAHQSGGWASIRSAPERGSCVTLFLPLPGACRPEAQLEQAGLKRR